MNDHICLLFHLFLYLVPSRQIAKLLSNRRNLGLPHPLTRRRVRFPPLWFGWGGEVLAGEGVGANSDEGTDTVVL
jgi:hypothetical protein